MNNRELLKTLLYPKVSIYENKWLSFLNSVNEDVLWYLSADFDFSDIAILNSKLNSTNISPSVYFHTDFRYNEDLFDNDGLNVAGLEIIDKFELLARTDFGKPADDILHQCDFNYGRIFLINANIKYDNIEIKNKNVLYFILENNHFLENFLMMQKFKMSHIFSLHSRLDGENTVPMLWKLITDYNGFKYLFSDNSLFLPKTLYEELDDIRIGDNMLLKFKNIIIAPDRLEMKIYEIIKL